MNLSLPPAVHIRGDFFKIQLHRELTHLPLERGNASFILCNDTGLGFLVVQNPPVILRKP